MFKVSVETEPLCQVNTDHSKSFLREKEIVIVDVGRLAYVIVDVCLGRLVLPVVELQ